MLTRRIAFRTSPHSEDKIVWETLQPGATGQVQSLLLQGFAVEPTTPVRNKICDTLAEIARYLLEGAADNEGW